MVSDTHRLTSNGPTAVAATFQDALLGWFSANKDQITWDELLGRIPTAVLVFLLPVLRRLNSMGTRGRISPTRLLRVETDDSCDPRATGLFDDALPLNFLYLIPNNLPLASWSVSRSGANWQRITRVNTMFNAVDWDPLLICREAVSIAIQKIE